MPRLCIEEDSNISVSEFLDECSVAEIEQVRSLIGYDYSEMHIQYLKGEFDLKKVIQSIGKDEVQKVLNQL